MSIDLSDKLVETASKVAVTRNEFGDINYGATTTSDCLYRDISLLSQSGNREQVTIDGLLWFGSSESVEKGDIYYHSSEGYLRIVKITRAKRLVADNTLQFIKCEVIKIRQIS